MNAWAVQKSKGAEFGMKLMTSHLKEARWLWPLSWQSPRKKFPHLSTAKINSSKMPCGFTFWNPGKCRTREFQFRCNKCGGSDKVHTKNVNFLTMHWCCILCIKIWSGLGSKTNSLKALKGNEWHMFQTQGIPLKQTLEEGLIMDVAIQVFWCTTNCQQGVDDMNKTWPGTSSRFQRHWNKVRPSQGSSSSITKHYQSRNSIIMTSTIFSCLTSLTSPNCGLDVPPEIQSKIITVVKRPTTNQATWSWLCSRFFLGLSHLSWWHDL